MNKSRFRAPMRYMAPWLAVLAGVGFTTSSPVAAQAVPPSAAPAEWVHYAEAATAAIRDMLQADSETAIRFRAYLHQTCPADDQPTPSLVLKVWVDKGGVISRMEFTPFAHPEPNADLGALVVGQRLPGDPPAGMLLPIRVAVQLDPSSSTPPAEPAPRRDPRLGRAE